MPRRATTTLPDDLPDLPATTARSVRRRLLAWYDKHRRDLPWRHRQSDAYAQLLAEFMLQQTQVATVIDYYRRFVERYPTVADLARADEDDVLALWSGLGYYRRARHLHAAARQVVDQHGGVVPPDVETLMTLPGIGRYTAGAIASVAYGKRAPVLDGNVQRVLMRILAIDTEPQAPATKNHLWSVAEILLPRKRCGDFNQAMMELGATVCSPKSPNCLLCPVRNHCRASQQGLTDRIPPTNKRAKVRAATMVVAAVRAGDALLFVQRPDTGLWASLWELPTEGVAVAESIANARNRLQLRLPVKCTLLAEPVGQVTRQLTHRRVTFHCFVANARKPRHLKDMDGQACRWVRAGERAELGISRACEAILDLIE